ncbi:MAG: alpha/beta hydrolase [Chloroflexota bacterium]
MSIATVDNQLIHYEVVGHGQPLVFIHGWLGSWRYWWPSMQSLAARHRTYAFDLWGFGDSSKNEAFYSLDAYVDMLDNFMDVIGIRRPITLVGHSLGASVALRYACKNQDDIHRLALISPPIDGSNLHERMLNSDPPSIMSRVSGLSFPEVDRELRKIDQGAFTSLVQEVRQLNFTEEIKNCSIPLMIVFGEQDQIIKQPTYTLPEPTENRTYISLDCNHFPMLEQRVKFNRLMLDLIHADGNLQDISPKDHWTRRNR